MDGVNGVGRTATYETIEYERQGQIAVVTLARPKVYNAINDACIEELEQALAEAERDSVVRVVIITGGPRCFCAGADISEIKGFTGADSGLEHSRKFQGIFQRVEHCSKPTIAAITRFALGGGCELALSCDIRVLEEGAELGLPEIDIGAFPAGGGTQMLPRLIGMARAKEILLTGRRIGADEALNLGLANRVVKVGEALHVAMELAGQLAAKSPTALTAMKRSVNAGAGTDLTAGLVIEAEVFAALSVHPNFREGIAAFLEKRPPNFQDD